MNLNTYRNIGFSMIPVNKGDKKPLGTWKEYTTRHPTEEELSTWFPENSLDGGASNIGVVTGAVSGIIVLDVDGVDGEESLKSLGEVPRTATVRTGKGRHLYFRHPGGTVRNFTRKLPGLDLRGDGSYVVAPPSIHSNGKRYVWELSPGDAGIAEPPHWLIDLMEKKQDRYDETNHSGGERGINPVRSGPTGRLVGQLLGELVMAEEGSRNDTLNKVSYKMGNMAAANEIDGDWAKRKLLAVGKQISLSDDECETTVNSGFSAGLKNPSNGGKLVYEIIDTIPDAMDRPIKLFDGKGYGATWVPVGPVNSEYESTDIVLVVFGDSGEIYSDLNISGSHPLDDLKFTVDLPHKPKAEKLLSPHGLRRWAAQDLPTPGSVLDRTVKSVDAFVSFENSLSDQKGMCELVACWIMGTYALDAFDVVGYLWPTGERGSGKTQLLNTVSALAYLGRTITSGSSFAAIRDEAEYGASIAFDDCENVRSMENSKRELLLAGNMRGTQISLKEPIGEGEWRTRHINNFAPRLFSSIGLPDEVLGSRTISIPLIASTDREKTRRNPSSRDKWPVDLRALIDDFWLLAVAHLPEIRKCDQEASKLSELHARGHDIWRMPLAIAYWLEERHSVAGIFQRLTDISVNYQSQKEDIQGAGAITILLQALNELLAGSNEDISPLETQEILTRIQQIAGETDQVEPEVMTLTATRVGTLLGRLGFAKRKANGRRRAWVVERNTLRKIAESRSVMLPDLSESPGKWDPPMLAIEPFARPPMPAAPDELPF